MKEASSSAQTHLILVFLVFSTSLTYWLVIAGGHEGPVTPRVWHLKETRSLLIALKRLELRKGEKGVRIPSDRHEQLMRRVKANLKEFQHYVLHEAFALCRDLGVSVDNHQYFTRFVKESRRALTVDFRTMVDHDGFKNQRVHVMAALNRLVQQRLTTLQNPRNCSTSKRLICHHRNECGLGCDVHNFANCLPLAYALNRTLLVQPKNWIYHEEGYEEIFMPFSESCVDDRTEPTADYPSEWGRKKIFFFPKIAGN